MATLYLDGAASGGGGLAATDIDTIAEINAILTSGSLGVHQLISHTIGAHTAAVETDTGLDIPVGALVVIAWPVVTTPGGTLDIGLLSSETGGDANGFVQGIDVSTNGSKVPEFVTDVQIPGDQQFGALLFSSPEDGGGTARATHRHHAIQSGNAQSLTYTSSNDALRGTIYCLYIDPTNAS